VVTKHQLTPVFVPVIGSDCAPTIRSSFELKFGNSEMMAGGFLSCWIIQRCTTHYDVVASYADRRMCPLDIAAIGLVSISLPKYLQTKPNDKVKLAYDAFHKGQQTDE